MCDSSRFARALLAGISISLPGVSRSNSLCSVSNGCAYFHVYSCAHIYVCADMHAYAYAYANATARWVRMREVASMLFLPREVGQGVTEYALLLLLVTIILLGVLLLLGPVIGNVFSTIIMQI